MCAVSSHLTGSHGAIFFAIRHRLSRQSESNKSSLIIIYLLRMFNDDLLTAVIKRNIECGTVDYREVVMTRSIRIFLSSLLAVVLIPLGPLVAQGQEIPPGSTIRFIVGYSPGGVFDTYTRLIARHFGKHVPGNPTVVVDNMPGAGGIVAANHIYNRAKPDGLTVGAWAAPLILQHIMGNDAAKFDGRKFGYLGVASPHDSVCTFNRESGIKTVEDWFASKRPVKIAAIGPGTSTSDVPKILKGAVGLPMNVLDGYKGGANTRIAVESGEVDGYCGPWQGVKTIWRDAFESGRIRAILQVTVKSHPELKNVPLAINYAKRPEDRLLLEVADSAYGAQFPYSIPPGVPPDSLRLLQRAFTDTLKDPDLLTEAKKSDLEIQPIDGPNITKTFAKLYKLDQAMIAKLKQLILPKKN